MAGAFNAIESVIQWAVMATVFKQLKAIGSWTYHSATFRDNLI